MAMVIVTEQVPPKIKQCICSHRIKVLIAMILTIFCIYYLSNRIKTRIKRKYGIYSERRAIEEKLQDTLRYDKGTGCEMPLLDPYNKEIAEYEKNNTPIVCKGRDWVKCYHSECSVVKAIRHTMRKILCTYRDIIYITDDKYILGAPVDVYGDQPYVLTRSDHVSIKCRGRPLHRCSMQIRKWVGLAVGFRKNVPTVTPPPESRNNINVLIFGYDSLSRNVFLRQMPKTNKYITEELKMTFFYGYNIVGEATAAALFGLLSGATELEMPDARKRPKNRRPLNYKRFIFYKLKQHGYRTAYFEDAPSTGTFQRRYNGFNRQPADHYLRAFYLEDYKKHHKYCVGATPRHRLMMNITQQLLSFPNSKLFIFTFISDVSHDDFTMIKQADNATVQFFKYFKEQGWTKDTLLIFLGDHGTRNAPYRKTLQVHLEERLPLLAILLPEDLLKTRPSAQKALELNSKVLTTPRDVYATVLDAVGLTQHIPKYKVPGADLPRAMTLLEPIPKNRSCSEAGIELHWCACATWSHILPEDPMYMKAAHALFDSINRFIEPVRSYCAPRTLTSVEWVRMQQTNKEVKSSFETKEFDGIVGQYGSPLRLEKEYYQIRLIVDPGAASFEGTVTYNTLIDEFTVDSSDVSRTNRYNHEPDCISLTHPNLNKYCYCRNLLPT